MSIDNQKSTSNTLIINSNQITNNSTANSYLKMPIQQFDFKLPIHPRQDSQDLFGKMSNSSTHNNSHTPNRKSMIMY